MIIVECLWLWISNISKQMNTHFIKWNGYQREKERETDRYRTSVCRVIVLRCPMIISFFSFKDFITELANFFFILYLDRGGDWLIDWLIEQQKRWKIPNQIYFLLVFHYWLLVWDMGNDLVCCCCYCFVAPTLSSFIAPSSSSYSLADSNEIECRENYTKAKQI